MMGIIAERPEVTVRPTGWHTCCLSNELSASRHDDATERCTDPRDRWREQYADGGEQVGLTRLIELAIQGHDNIDLRSEGELERKVVGELIGLGPVLYSGSS